MFLSSIGLYLFIRWAKDLRIHRDIVSLFMFGVPAFIFGVIAFLKNELEIDHGMILLIFVVSFFLSYLGNKYSLKALEESPNQGYSLIIQKSYAIFTSILSVFIFNSELSVAKFVSILIIIGFLYLVVSGNGKKIGIKKMGNWVFYSVICFLIYGILSLVARWVGINGIEAISWTFYLSFFTFLFILIDFIFKYQTYNFKLSNKSLISLICIGIWASLFFIFVQYARVDSPNVGYPNAINVASNAFLTPLLALFFKDKLDRRKVIGVIGVTIGLFFLVILP